MTLHSLSVVWFHFLSLLLGVSFFHPNLPTWKPHGNPNPTSVSATVRSKSLRTTATWTVINQVIGYRGIFRNDSITKIDRKAHDDIFKWHVLNTLVGVGVAGASTNTQNMSALRGLQDVTCASFQQLTAVWASLKQSLKEFCVVWRLSCNDQVSQQGS